MNNIGKIKNRKKAKNNLKAQSFSKFSKEVEIHLISFESSILCLNLSKSSLDPNSDFEVSISGNKMNTTKMDITINQINSKYLLRHITNSNKDIERK